MWKTSTMARYWRPWKTVAQMKASNQLKAVHQMALEKITTRLMAGSVMPRCLRSQRKATMGTASESTVRVWLSAARSGKPAKNPESEPALGLEQRPEERQQARPANQGAVHGRKRGPGPVGVHHAQAIRLRRVVERRPEKVEGEEVAPRGLAEGDHAADHGDGDDGKRQGEEGPGAHGVGLGVQAHRRGGEMRPVGHEQDPEEIRFVVADSRTVDDAAGDPAHDAADQQIVEERIDEHLAGPEQAGGGSGGDGAFHDSTLAQHFREPSTPPAWAGNAGRRRSRWGEWPAT